MLLSDVLSRPQMSNFVPVEGFISKNLHVGEQRKIDIGRIAQNYYCKKCNAMRTFWSNDKLYCIGVNINPTQSVCDEQEQQITDQISIDCVLKCECGTTIAVWFIIDSRNSIASTTPEVRILKQRERYSDLVAPPLERYGNFTELFEKANKAYREGFGAGSIIYLRKVLEIITCQIADESGVSTTGTNGGRKPFRNLLEEVNNRRQFIPNEFSNDGYKLFGDLSEVIHAEYDEQEGLKKFEDLHRLVVGVIENVQNNREIMSAIGSLGWNNEGGTPQ